MKSIFMCMFLILSSSTAFASCNVSLSEGTTIEKISCNKGNALVNKDKTANKKVEAKKAETPKIVGSQKKARVVKSYVVPKDKGIASVLGSNEEALKAAKDLGLKLTKTEKYSHVVIVPEGFKFALYSDGKYRKN